TFSLDEYNAGFRDELKIKVDDHLSFILGGDGNFAYTRLHTRLPLFPRFPQFPSPGTENPPLTEFKNDQLVAEVGWYAEAELRYGKLRVLPGVRLEQISYAERVRTGLTPRLTA